MEGGGQGRVWDGVMKGGDRGRYSLILVSFSFVGGCLRTWMVVFIRGWLFSYVAIDVICGRSFSYVGVRLYAWAVVFVSGRSFSYEGDGCGCGLWTWTRCGQLCRRAGRVHRFVGGLCRL